MKLLKCLISLLVFGFTTGVYAQRGQETSFGRELNNRDDQPVREFVESKENIDIKEKAKNLEISGDVRFEWRSIQEKGVVYFQDPYGNSYGYEDDKHVSQNYRYLRGGNHVEIMESLSLQMTLTLNLTSRLNTPLKMHGLKRICNMIILRELKGVMLVVESFLFLIEMEVRLLESFPVIVAGL